MTKINSYIGFAIKGRSIVYGTDNILKSSKLKLVVASDELADNSLKKLQNHYKNTVILPQNEYLALNLQTKAFGILDANLANAIQNCLKNAN